MGRGPLALPLALLLSTLARLLLFFFLLYLRVCQNAAPARAATRVQGELLTVVRSSGGRGSCSAWRFRRPSEPVFATSLTLQGSLILKSET